MILGFAHVAIGCELKKEAVTYRDIDNHISKMKLMRKPSETHDLVVEFPGMVPLELVNYSKGLISSPSRFGVETFGSVELRARDIEAEGKFFAGLGIRSTKRMVHIASHLKAWRVNLWFHTDPKAPIDPPLDIAGYAALAFYSTDVEKDAAALISRGGRESTGKFSLRLGRKDLDVCLLRSPEGTIVELIKVHKG